MGHLPIGDGFGEFSFARVAVPDPGDRPVVEHHDGRPVPLVEAEVFEQLGASVVGAGAADLGEGDRVAAGLGQEVAAEAEHVGPGAQVQVRELG